MKPLQQGSSIVGEVRDFQSRQETRGAGQSSTSIIVWSFRVVRFDDQGNAITPVPVEIRSYSIRGVLSDGDRVEIQERWTPGKTLRPRRLRNLTTGGGIEAKRSRDWIVAVVFAFIVLGFLVFVMGAGSYFYSLR